MLGDGESNCVDGEYSGDSVGFFVRTCKVDAVVGGEVTEVSPVV